LDGAAHAASSSGMTMTVMANADLRAIELKNMRSEKNA
jgi:hypothetical protein